MPTPDTWTDATLDALRLAYGGSGRLLDAQAQRVRDLSAGEFFSAWAAVRGLLGVADHARPEHEVQTQSALQLQRVAATLVSDLTHLVHAMSLRASELLAAGANDPTDPVLDADAFRQRLVGFAGMSAIPVSALPADHPFRTITPYLVDGVPCILCGPGPAGGQFYRLAASRQVTDYHSEQARRAVRERRRVAEEKAERERLAWANSPAGQAVAMAEANAREVAKLKEELAQFKAQQAAETPART